MPLRVARITDEARGVRSFELVLADGGELPPFTPGSHVKVQTPSGALRRYSLCNGPAETHRYVIAVKLDEQGRGASRSMHTDLREGDVLPTSVPENAFELVEGAASYTFIAGGIGITPILSMIRHLREQGFDAWKLIYLSRWPETTAFVQELKDGASRGQVTVHHTLGKPENAFDLWPVLEKPNRGHVYCCGPRRLMDDVRDMSGHWSAKNVHFESFEDGDTPRPDDKPFTLRLAKSGKEFEVPVGKSILTAMREHGLQSPSSCESGTCGTCRTNLLEGEADHRDMVLLPEEQSSQIMICVSRAKSERLVVDL
jgi:phthalate 4,5-dioxygenase reductase subunit